MDFMTAVKTCFSKYVTFQGRAPRSEFWWFTLFVTVATIALAFVDGVVFGLEMVFSPLSDLFSLATLLPGIAVTVRRLHDVDRSGWWVLLILVPIIGWIILLVWEVTKGTEGPNRFGNDPLGGGGDWSAPEEEFAPSSIPRVGD